MIQTPQSGKGDLKTLHNGLSPVDILQVKGDTSMNTRALNVQNNSLEKKYGKPIRRCTEFKVKRNINVQYVTKSLTPSEQSTDMAEKCIQRHAGVLYALLNFLRSVGVKDTKSRRIKKIRNCMYAIIVVGNGSVAIITRSTPALMVEVHSGNAAIVRDVSHTDKR